jgi:hypothetical protein
VSIRVTIRNGQIVPLEPLPPEWADGRELQLSGRGNEPADTARNGAAAPGLTEDVDEGVDWLTDEEYERFQAVLTAMRREQKELMRRRMELS